MRMLRVSFCVAGALLLLIGPAHAVVIDYPDFSDLSAFTLNGATASINSGGPVFYNGQYVLRLTNALSQGGSAFLTGPIPLEDAGGFEASFSTFFAFQISNPLGSSDPDGQGADGIVFVVQTQASNVGGVGGGIGYLGISPSVGVEFDTWDNGSQDGYNGNHVGIDLNGSVASVARYNVTPRMNDGDIWYAWVDYDGPNDNLEVRLSLTSARPASPDLTYSVDLATVLGTPDSYVGFTSGTGAAGGWHDIRQWVFISTYAPIDPLIPEPGTLALLAGGLCALVARRRRRAA